MICWLSQSFEHDKNLSKMYKADYVQCESKVLCKDEISVIYSPSHFPNSFAVIVYVEHKRRIVIQLMPYKSL